jgi:tellurite resistance protein TerC
LDTSSLLVLSLTYLLPPLLDIGFWGWAGFNIFVLAMLALDLGVFNRKAHVISVKEALIWSAVWISLACLFGLGLYYFEGKQIALEFFAGYLIEKSLSVDNLFVFILLFTYFRVEPMLQHKVLYWGILGALIMRAALIVVGSILIAKFHWIIYIFGAFLIFTGVKMAISKDEEDEVTENFVVKLFRRFFPVVHEYHGAKFFIKQNGRRFATPLFIVLIIVETTDLVFALDSIPAIFAVSQHPFIVYTSNVFAILGLRSLYFALAGVMNMFHYLKVGLAIILCFVGAKMLLESYIEIPILVALGVIAGVLTLSIVASIIWPKKEDPA